MRRTWMIFASAVMLGAGATGQSQVAAPPAAPPATLADGARWTASVPARWNGTLLLWSHGYSPVPHPPEDAPASVRNALLARGYALAGSSYADAGWALDSAVPDQFATIEAFAKVHGRPKRVIAWGMSMGGLVTTALAETAPRRIDGALALCPSIGGAVGMMNMALDGAYAFKMLLAPGSAIRLTGVDDDRANGARVAAVVAEAQRTPQGRARLALAGVLAGLPGWTTPGAPAPAADDAVGQEAEMAKTFAMGVFLPRVDQERRGGGGFSWNSGVDYRRQLARSGRGALVARLYRTAGLDLGRDLATLAAGPRVAAAPDAVAYMMAHYTPTARPLVPILSVQNIGDGLTSPSLQRSYVEAAARRAPGAAEALWVAGAGHCTFATGTMLAALDHLERRVARGRWPARPAGFVAHTPPPMLRPCLRGGACR